MSTRLLSLACLIGISMLVTACTSSTDPVDRPRASTLIASTVKDDLRLEVYADHALVTGYNDVYFKVYRGGVLDRHAHLHMTPMMYMGSHDHACPSMAPAQTPDADGFYKAAVIFTMPSDSLWFLNMEVHDEGHTTEAALSLRVPVGSGNTVNVLRSGANATMVVTILPPSAWKEGMNNVTVLLHTTEDGLNFVAVDNATLTLTPSMPSMGHGSHGNIDPKPVGGGWYQGAVNLIMRGEWALDLATAQGDGLPWTTRFWIMVP